MATAMNVKNTIKAYIDKFIDGVSGMKVIILDEETKKIISVVYTVTEILDKEVFLIEDLGVAHDRMGHLKALVFIRPTAKSVKALTEEITNPKYGEYHIFFSNITEQKYLQALADADVKEMIKAVQEYYADYLALEPHIFSFKLTNSLSMCKPRSRWGAGEDLMFQRSVQGLISVMLSLKKRPLIRYQAASDLARSMAGELKSLIDKEDARGDGLFDFRSRDGSAPLLLLLDRRDDPITPLLCQWTYQAMVHELISIDTNRVDLSHVKDVKKEMKEVVLNPDFDSFYKTNQYSNFGDLGIAVKELLEAYSAKSKGTTDVNSIEDMQKFMEIFPEFKKLSNNVSKHVTIMSELARQVGDRSLMEVSALEQEMACGSDHTEHAKELLAKLEKASVSDEDALRLVLIYAIKYEKYGGNVIKKAMQTLTERGLGPRVSLVEELLACAGAANRGSNLFGDKSGVSGVFAGLTKELKGVSNVYTQHKPLLSETLEALKRNKLKADIFPYEGRSASTVPNDVIVFILGGLTYEESLCVKEFNAAGGSMNVILGGTDILNSTTFLDGISSISTASVAVRPGSVSGSTSV